MRAGTRVAVTGILALNLSVTEFVELQQAPPQPLRGEAAGPVRSVRR